MRLATNQPVIAILQLIHALSRHRGISFLPRKKDTSLERNQYDQDEPRPKLTGPEQDEKRRIQ